MLPQKSGKKNKGESQKWNNQRILENESNTTHKNKENAIILLNGEKCLFNFSINYVLIENSR